MSKIFPDAKNFASLTRQEAKERGKLTIMENLAVAEAVRAIRALPKRICLHVDQDGVFIQKRVTDGYTVVVGTIKHKWLSFDNSLLPKKDADEFD